MTKIILHIFLLLLFLPFGTNIGAYAGESKQHIPDLMPLPAEYELGTGRLELTRGFKVGLGGAADERLRAYVARVLTRMEGRTVMSFGRGFVAAQDEADLWIETKTDGGKYPKLGTDESYSLKIDGERAVLRAATNIGAMRGLETFLQLLSGDRKGFYFPAVSIEDRPRFPWRGLLIDVARHYQPLGVLKRNIDGMAALKLNVLHWHLTEDQGFRVESKTFPKLHTMGSDGLFYTHEEIREIIDYAAERGIRVMPEFDMPGHATAWLVGHPELASLPGPYEIERKPGIFDPTLDPTREETYRFLDRFLTEMANLFPDEYMHIGGDENEGKHWDASERIQAFMKEKGIKDNHELQTYFNKRVLSILEKNGKIMMGWDEIFQPDLPKNVVIHSWRGQEALAEAARQGYTGVLSNGYYIDLIYPASDHYLVDPLPEGSDLTPEQRKRVLGGEATMWGEWVSPETIDSRIWTRLPAIAERLWSPASVRNVDSMYRRLDTVLVRLEELGLTHFRNQDVLLRRLAGNRDTAALKVLVGLIEPVKQYRRYQQRPQTMLDPLTGLIDASGPDAPGARKFERLVGNYLENKDPAALELLRQTFMKWQNAGTELGPLMETSPALHEAAPLASELRELGRIGLEAAAYLGSNEAAPREWLETNRKLILEMEKPKASAVEFMVTGGIKKLMEAASPQTP